MCNYAFSLDCALHIKKLPGVRKTAINFSPLSLRSNVSRVHLMIHLRTGWKNLRRATLQVWQHARLLQFLDGPWTIVGRTTEYREVIILGYATTRVR
jgi:hypothetical protein